jgi:hypothetical protein
MGWIEWYILVYSGNWPETLYVSRKIYTECLLEARKGRTWPENQFSIDMKTALYYGATRLELKDDIDGVIPPQLYRVAA